MRNIELAFNLGFKIDKDGVIYNNNGDKIRLSLKNGKYPSFTINYLNKSYMIYASRMQSYMKYGKNSFHQNAAYINKNPLDCSYDNISLRAFELNSSRYGNTKICTKCNMEFPIELFKIKNKRTGLRLSECPECNKTSKKESYYKHFEKNKNKINERNRAFRDKRNIFLKNKKSSGCIICGEQDHACLDFHHVNGDDKQYNISSIISNLSIKEIEEEMDKCVVLCANCHRKLHFYNLTINELKEKHDSL